MVRPPTGKMPTSVYNRPSSYRFKESNKSSIPTIKGEYLEEYLKRNNLDIRQGRDRNPGEKEILVDLGQFSQIMFVKKK